MTDNELQTQITAAVEEAMKALRDAEPTKPIRPTVYELGLDVAKQFGVSAVIVMAMLAIAWQVIPPWVNQNIALQQSLVGNLDLQTANMAKLVPQLNDLQDKAMETAVFRKQVVVEHAVMQNELAGVKEVTDTVQAEQARQREEHTAIMQTQQETVKTLKTICESFKKTN